MQHIGGVRFVWHKLKTTNTPFQNIVIFGRNKNYYKMSQVTSIGLKLQALEYTIIMVPMFHVIIRRILEMFILQSKVLNINIYYSNACNVRHFLTIFMF